MHTHVLTQLVAPAGQGWGLVWVGGVSREVGLRSANGTVPAHRGQYVI